MWMEFGNAWSKTAPCIFVKQTIKQTNRQTDEMAIGNCVLAKISKMMITRKIMMTTVMIKSE